MYFVTKTGQEPGIYKNFQAVLEQLSSAPEEVCIQSFERLKEARDFIRDTGISLKVHPSITKMEKAKTLTIFADGSDQVLKKQIGIGIVFLEDREVIEEISQSFPYSASIFQNGHEYIAVLYALKWAKKHNYAKVHLHSDCLNLVNCINKKSPQLNNRYQLYYTEIFELIIQMDVVAYHDNKKDFEYAKRADWLSKHCDQNEWIKSKTVSSAQIEQAFARIKEPLCNTFQANQWIEWQVFCAIGTGMLRARSIGVKMSKIKKSKQFKRYFDMKKENDQYYVRRRGQG